MVRVGFLGCGGVSHAHVTRLSSLEAGEAEIVGLCDVNVENARRLMKTANRFRNLCPEPLTEKSIYLDHLKMFKELGLEAVIICTYHVLHYEHVMTALSKGLHVLVEKPMALDIGQAVEMKDKAQKEGLILAVGYQRHFQPEYFHARQIIKSGKVGSPQFIVAWLTQDLRGAIGSRTWYMDPARAGGGQVICSGTHLNDIVLWVTDSEPKRVKAIMERQGAQIEIYATLSAELSNGALASIAILADAPEKAVREEVRIWCSRGAVFIKDGKVYVHEKGKDLAMISPENMPRPSPSPDVNFIRAILGKEECLVPASCGVNATKLEQMAYEDAKPILNNLRQ